MLYFSSSRASVYWRASSDGNFSVRSAFYVLQNSEEQPSMPIWRKLWKWPVHEKIKQFFWQVLHKRLPTNALRFKRGLSMSENCSFECNSEESILLILHDCEVAKQVWLYFINPISVHYFFSFDLRVWLKINTTQNLGSTLFSNSRWLSTFCTVCWSL